MICWEIPFFKIMLLFCYDLVASTIPLLIILSTVSLEGLRANYLGPSISHCAIQTIFSSFILSTYYQHIGVKMTSSSFFVINRFVIFLQDHQKERSILDRFQNGKFCESKRHIPKWLRSPANQLLANQSVSK